MPQLPIGFILNELRKGLVIPFLGAGASASARPTDARATDRLPEFLPSARELSERLAQDAAFPKSEDHYDLAKVASYFCEETADRASLLSYLHETFDHDYQVGQIHQFLAELDVPLLIVTTNYDDLIERAFRLKGKPFHLVTYPTDRKDLAASVLWWRPGATEPEPHPPKTLPLSLTNTSIIYKMHGGVDRQTRKWDSFVITEEDYVDFLARMTGQTAIPARFMLEFRRRHFLFLGYGLKDWNLRVMMKNLNTALLSEDAGTYQVRESSEDSDLPGNLRSWAVQRHPSELEQILWGARRVKIYDLDINDFVVELRAKMGL